MKTNSRNNKGFTLVEVVIAMTLTAIIFTILLASLRLAHKSEEKGAEREDLAQRTRILTDRLTWLIRGAYFYIDKSTDEKILYFSGSDSGIGFVTTSVDHYDSGIEDAAGLKWVEISAGGEGLKVKEAVYFLKDNPEGGSRGKEYILDTGVRRIGFQYLEAEKGGDSEWVGSWDKKSKDRLPLAVKVSLALEHKGQTLNLPEFVVQIRTGEKKPKTTEAK